MGKFTNDTVRERAFFEKLALTKFKKGEIKIELSYEDDGLTEIDYKRIKNFVHRLKREGKNPRYTITAGGKQIISRNSFRP